MISHVDTPSMLKSVPFVEHSWTVWPNCVRDKSLPRGGLLKECSLLNGPFFEGEVVAIDQKSNAKHCHGTVVSAGHTSTATVTATSLGGTYLAYDELNRLLEVSLYCSGIPKDGQTVQVMHGCSVIDVLQDKLVRVLSPEVPRVFIVPDTTSYRQMAKTQVGTDDAVLEIGSSLGECTHILTCHAKSAVGIDVAGDLIEDSRHRHPQCRFEWLDCFEEPERLRHLCRELQDVGVLKVFIDVGGDRSTDDVCQVLLAVASAIQEDAQVIDCGAADSLGERPTPALIVVKSRKLAAAALSSCDCDGNVHAMTKWWELVTVRPPPGSEKQLKRKLARARKAKWQTATDDQWDAFESYRAKWDVASDYGRMAEEARHLKCIDPHAWGSTLRDMITNGQHTC